MDVQEIKQTPIWELYEKGRNYLRMCNTFSQTDKNFRFYNGDQWDGAKLGDVEPVQKNFIKPIVKYKVGVVHDNLYGIVYSSMNFDNPQFQQMAGKYCEMLNRYAMRVWEKDKMDFHGRNMTKDAAIDSEGVLYAWFDEETMMPVNEFVDKTDIYYGNENDEEIQNQPYILMKKRMPVTAAKELARSYGVSEEKLALIVGDNDTFEEPGEEAKLEIDDMVPVVYKFYKMDGTVHFAIATRWLEIAKDQDMGMSIYPFAHFLWESKKGSARGEGEVRFLIPNQIEVNRTEMRRILTVKLQAYPQKVVDTSKIRNPEALNKVGITIKTNGKPVDDVNKVVGVIQPAQMSPDVKLLQDDLINMTRELAGAGDVATGQIDPESASGRAILAVQQASQAPMTEQKERYKNFLEDVARIWLEILTVNAQDGVNLEDVQTDPVTGEEVVQLVNVPQSVLQQLKPSVKIDVTPKGVYDKFAQEQTIENLLIQGFFSAQRVSELEIYVKVLDDDAVAPKQKIKDAIAYIKEQQRKIAMIQANAQLMQQRAQQFLMDDPDGQAEQISDARMQRMMQGQEVPEEIQGEEEVTEAEETEE